MQLRDRIGKLFGRNVHPGPSDPLEQPLKSFGSQHRPVLIAVAAAKDRRGVALSDRERAMLEATRSAVEGSDYFARLDREVWSDGVLEAHPSLLSTDCFSYVRDQLGASQLITSSYQSHRSPNFTERILLGHIPFNDTPDPVAKVFEWADGHFSAHLRDYEYKGSLEAGKSTFRLIVESATDEVTEKNIRSFVEYSFEQLAQTLGIDPVLMPRLEFVRE